MLGATVDLAKLDLVQELAVLRIFGEPRHCGTWNHQRQYRLRRVADIRSAPIPQPMTTLPLSRICMLPSLEHACLKLGKYSRSSSAVISARLRRKTIPRAVSAVCSNWLAPFEKSVTSFSCGFDGSE